LKAEERGLNLEALQRRYIGKLPADLANPDLTPASYGRLAQYDKVTWPEWLRSQGASAGAVAMMTLGGDSRDLSALYVLRQIARLGTTTASYKLRGGMDSLPRAMAQSLSGVIRYNAAVVRMNRSAQQVRVDYLERAEPKSILASRVILTIPFSTLRNIEVRPPLSREKERVIDDLSYFPSTRFVLQSRTRFWRGAGLTGSARTDQPAEIWDSTHEVPVTRGILGATVGGALGRSLIDLSPADCLAYGVELVAQSFPPIGANFERGAVRRWAIEPWSRGAFAVFRPGQMTSMLPVMASPEGRVHFAGEHTSTWPGWMEGALESGERAAREVIDMDTPR
jgi:monoamine oxidase